MPNWIICPLQELDQVSHNVIWRHVFLRLVSAFEAVALGIGYNPDLTSRRRVDMGKVEEKVRQLWQVQEFTEMIGPDIRESARIAETLPYLCAAAHLDKDFRDYIIKDIVEEKYRAVGDLYGVDLIAVVKWCFAARERDTKRDRKLSLLVGILFLIELGILF